MVILTQLTLILVNTSLLLHAITFFNAVIALLRSVPSSSPAIDYRVGPSIRLKS